MKKSGKIIACLSALAMCASALNLKAINNAYASADNGFNPEEIETSVYKPEMSVDQITLTYDEAQEIIKSEGTVPVRISVSGADLAYSATGIHVKFLPSEYGTELSLTYKRTGKPRVYAGDALENLAFVSEYEKEYGLFLTTMGMGNEGYDGVMYSIEFKLPENIQGGETFPIKIDYQHTPEAEDLFTNKENDRTGQLMQAWLFTRGIHNGYIKIADRDASSGTDIVSGDANGDGEINSADAVFIMQALSNPDEYQLTEEGKANADVVNRGDGVTAMDALAIQLIGLNLVKAEDFPITTEDLEKLMK